MGWEFGMGKRKLTGTLNWVNKDGKYKKVKPELLDEYLHDGWVIGGPAKGTIHIFNGDKHKMVHKNEIDKYICDGWTTSRKQ